MHPRPHFAAGAPNFLPTHDPRSAHSAALRFPAAPVGKRLGLMRAEAGAGGGAWARERRGTSAWLSRASRRASLLGCHAVPTSRRREKLARRGREKPDVLAAQKSVLSARTSAFGGPSAALRTVFGGLRAPLQKVSADPYFYRTSFSPTFPHSPPSARGGRAEAANPVSGGLSTAPGNGSARSEPLQKVSTDPYFYSTSSPPLFPTLRTRRSGVVLRARDSGSAVRAPRSLPGLLGLGLGG